MYSFCTFIREKTIVIITGYKIGVVEPVYEKKLENPNEEGLKYELTIATKFSDFVVVRRLEK
jgi:hypothetical protein